MEDWSLVKGGDIWGVPYRVFTVLPGFAHYHRSPSSFVHTHLSASLCARTSAGGGQIDNSTKIGAADAVGGGKAYTDREDDENDDGGLCAFWRRLMPRKTEVVKKTSWADCVVVLVDLSTCGAQIRLFPSNFHYIAFGDTRVAQVMHQEFGIMALDNRIHVCLVQSVGGDEFAGLDQVVAFFVGAVAQSWLDKAVSVVVVTQDKSFESAALGLLNEFGIEAAALFE